MSARRRKYSRHHDPTGAAATDAAPGLRRSRNSRCVPAMQMDCSGIHVAMNTVDNFHDRQSPRSFLPVNSSNGACLCDASVRRY
jgi:hypothetical protein